MKNVFFYSLHYSNINTPPPFLYDLSIAFNIKNDKVEIKYQKQFIDREQFSEEELEEEGFSTQDDSLVEGELDGAWLTFFKTLIANPNWTKNTKTESFNNNVLRLSSTDSEDLYLIQDGIEYQLEEILQALVESLQIEAPLSIFMRQHKGGKISESELYWSFKDRICSIKNNQKITALSWEEGRAILSLFYETDLSEQQIFKKKIPEGVTCINPGDETWYQTPKDKSWTQLLTKVFS